MRTVALLVLLAGCMDSRSLETPPKDTPVVKIERGGMTGFGETWIYANDLIVTSETHEGIPDRPRRSLVPGSFARVRAVIAALGPKALASSKGDPEGWIDYGQDYILAVPPINGFSSITRSWPEPALIAMLREIGDAEKLGP